MQVWYFCLGNDEAKDRQDLICVQQPLFFGQLIIAVELLNRLSDVLRTLQDHLDLVYGCCDFEQLIQNAG